MSSARAHTVLVVEDEPDLCELFRAILEAEGFVVVTAADGAQALTILSVSPVDLVVTDLMMPVLDGFGFLRAYAARPPPRAPVIAASAMHEYLRRALELGAIEAYDKATALAIVPTRARRHARVHRARRARVRRAGLPGVDRDRGAAVLDRVPRALERGGRALRHGARGLVLHARCRRCSRAASAGGSA